VNVIHLAHHILLPLLCTKVHIRRLDFSSNRVLTNSKMNTGVHVPIMCMHVIAAVKL